MHSLDNIVTTKLKKWQELGAVLSGLGQDEGRAFPAQIEGLDGSLASFFVRAFLDGQKSKKIQAAQYGTDAQSAGSLDVLAVAATERDALDLRQDLETVMEGAEIYCLASWGTLPYRPAPRGGAVFGERAAFLSKLLCRDNSPLNATPRVFIVSLRDFLSPFADPQSLQNRFLFLRKGQTIDTERLSQSLAQNGYFRVPRATVPGEFALRGEVLDIVFPGDQKGVRVTFDFDTIEKIKTFVPDTQVTEREVEGAFVFPMKEMIFGQDEVKELRQKIEEYKKKCIKNNTSSESFEEKSLQKDTSSENFEADGDVLLPFTDKALEVLESRLDDLELSGSCEGEELFYPLLFGRSLLDYLSPGATVFFFDFDRQLNSREYLLREWSSMYRKARLEEPCFPPKMALCDLKELLPKTKRAVAFRSLHTDLAAGEGGAEGALDAASFSFLQSFKLQAESSKSFFGNINYLKEQLEALQKDGYDVVVYADNENQALRIQQILLDAVNYKERPLAIVPKAISAGFSVPDIKLFVIQENEIFGRRKKAPKSIKSAKSVPIDTFVELTPGDAVVHVNYGIGLFKGIERVKSGGLERDYIKLEYADEDVAFVPIEQANLVQRYIGNEGEKPRLDRIGSKAWENRKSRVKQAVEELAQKLIDLYSRRKASAGYAFPKDTEWQTAFEAAFPYEDTPDQINVTKEVKADMERPVPMDRLLCGDVGYGKTEIAMRAAFKAVLGGRQVAFLAPTTILAEQHYETCMERFKNFPVSIAMLSRFVSHSEQKKILEKLKTGGVDILIGTHKIIQKDVQFKNLGLLIIDEEQRFGVKDKEKLKAIKNNIDCLAMSATPIPRTLHMSFLKIRDMSLLTTPPQNRQAIETFIDPYNDDRVAAAIRAEVARGGQVFYLHNRVETLEETKLRLERLVPEMLIDVAHGQMTSDELDDIFRRFKNGGFQVLVATTIIENGIDIPNVNTIIIDRADMYGVSQLYQLRGRVGRSDRKAYAYMFYPENKALSEVAMKRLQVISDFTELGSGFKIAMKDLELRGAGNLLGRDQSGNVYSVGFDLYLRLLNEAVERLTAQKEYVPQNEVLLELDYTGFIPDTYVSNPQVKMEIYKKIAGVTSRQELDGVYSELCDRFGPVPQEVESLLTLAEIKIIAGALLISSIKEKQGFARVEFSKVSDINVEKLMNLIKANPGSIKLDPSQPNVVLLQTGKIGLKEKGAFLSEMLESLV
ncbi:MAG: transcription-repair coupling factor [Treponema sp.]|nr:transcription-repair coupling factor [Treponema sp.]